MKLSPVFPLVALLALPALARAQPREAEQAPLAYEFDDELVQGDLQRPTGEILEVRKRARRTTLIEPRVSFVRELAKSIEDL